MSNNLILKLVLGFTIILLILQYLNVNPAGVHKSITAFFGSFILPAIEWLKKIMTEKKPEGSKSQPSGFKIWQFNWHFNGNFFSWGNKTRTGNTNASIDLLPQDSEKKNELTEVELNALIRQFAKKVIEDNWSELDKTSAETHLANYVDPKLAWVRSKYDIHGRYEEKLTKIKKMTVN